ncbi:tetratricopeptide repeat protein [Tropicimonas marinistellae]|uniref:tetratricopeptide repeat protein n=1 Tax=Tropicimonas marinistellae TaxID=1739787 RepID=UPI000832E9D1|nr:tetratricopeptide repeat protein [Tropicimonas marinistellae]
MSQADSFIEEVNEEVRREKLFSLLRKYGWIGIAAVVLLVGGAGWNEYRKASDKAAAEALGDSVLAAVEKPDDDARIAALGEIPADGAAASVVGLLTAAQQLTADDPAAAAEILRPLAADTSLSVVYSDLAALKMVLLGEAAFTPEDRAQVLDRLAQPGAPYRNLALEQKALDLAAAGKTDEAVAAARSLLEEPGLTQGLMQRVVQLIVALGADVAEEAG